MRWDGEMEAIWLATANSDLRSEQRELEAKIERLEAENFRLVTENERLRTLVADYENSICWETTCINCAKLLDANYDQHCEIERLRAEHTFVERLVAGQLSARLAEVEAERTAERALADRLAVALQEMFDPSLCDATQDEVIGVWKTAQDTLAGWEEARREQ